MSDGRAKAMTVVSGCRSHEVHVRSDVSFIHRRFPMRLLLALLAVGAAVAVAPVVSEAGPKSFQVAECKKDYKGS